MQRCRRNRADSHGFNLMSIGTPISQVVSGNSVWLRPTQWTDKSFSATTTRIGALSKPDFDYTNLGLLFPQNDATERIYILDQMLHQKKLGTAINLHVHFIQTSALVPKFVAQYRFYNNGAVVPGFTTIETSTGGGVVFTYPGSGSILQIIDFPDIPAPASEAVSANLELILYRDDNVVTGDVLVKFIDYHFQIDAAGSRQEYIK